MSVVIETTLGDVTVDLFLKERPQACLNFLKLCKLKFYNYNLFHTISRGFIAQTGDPTGSRLGGESIYGILDGPSKRYFAGEKSPRIKHTHLGLVSFVGNSDGMIGSQFFITLGTDLTYLDGIHCVFGEVMEGLDVIELLNETICDGDNRPYKDVRITHTVILEDPFNDIKGMQIPSRSPSPTPQRLLGGQIGADEEIDDTEGKTAQEISEMLAEREAKARATILEMVGDLPDAEMAPPENVLFICKLNPVTTDDDLEIIFSRFGKIVSCEVIRDRKTGDSLQYAFVEFNNNKSCEDAYFKMDNVLIDDRRIHVDFSQSVSKIKWHGKGRGVTTFDDSGRKVEDKRNDIGKGNYKMRDQERNNIKARQASPYNHNKNDLRDITTNENNKERSSKRREIHHYESSYGNKSERNYNSERYKREKSRSPYNRRESLSRSRRDRSQSPLKKKMYRHTRDRNYNPDRDEISQYHDRKGRDRSPKCNKTRRDSNSSKTQNVSKDKRDRSPDYRKSDNTKLFKNKPEISPYKTFQDDKTRNYDDRESYRRQRRESPLAHKKYKKNRTPSPCGNTSEDEEKIIQNISSESSSAEELKKKKKDKKKRKKKKDSSNSPSSYEDRRVKKKNRKRKTREGRSTS